MNLELFPKATIYVGKKELNYVFSDLPQRKGDVFISTPYIKSILKSMNVVEVCDGFKVHDGVIAIELPGHTPGSIGYLIEDLKLMFIGDAVKNMYEFLTKRPIVYFDSYDNWLKSMIKVLNLAKVIIPGHDVRLEVKNGIVKRVGKSPRIVLEVFREVEVKQFEINVT